MISSTRADVQADQIGTLTIRKGDVMPTKKVIEGKLHGGKVDDNWDMSQEPYITTSLYWMLRIGVAILRNITLFADIFTILIPCQWFGKLGQCGKLLTSMRWAQHLCKLGE